jgi:hypothetical protein
VTRFTDLDRPPGDPALRLVRLADAGPEIVRPESSKRTGIRVDVRRTQRAESATKDPGLAKARLVGLSSSASGRKTLFLCGRPSTSLPVLLEVDRKGTAPGGRVRDKCAKKYNVPAGLLFFMTSSFAISELNTLPRVSR